MEIVISAEWLVVAVFGAFLTMLMMGSVLGIALMYIVSYIRCRDQRPTRDDGQIGCRD